MGPSPGLGPSPRASTPPGVRLAYGHGGGQHHPECLFELKSQKEEPGRAKQEKAYADDGQDHGGGDDDNGWTGRQNHGGHGVKGRGPT